MEKQRSSRRRVKIGATLDPVTLGAVDAFIRQHPELDRSAVIDDALRLWWARQQEREMEAQFSEPASPAEVEELRAWRTVRDASAQRTFRRRS